MVILAQMAEAASDIDGRGRGIKIESRENPAVEDSIWITAAVELALLRAISASGCGQTPHNQAL